MPRLLWELLDQKTTAKIGRSMLRPYGKFKRAGETPELRKAESRCVGGCARAGAEPICGAVYVGWVDEENVGGKNVPLEQRDVGGIFQEKMEQQANC
jgi:hypothetical protein